MHSPKTAHTFHSFSRLLLRFHFQSRSSRRKGITSLVLLGATVLFALAAPKPSTLMPAASAYGWQPVLSAAARQAGMRVANLLTAGYAFKTAAFAPSLS